MSRFSQNRYSSNSNLGMQPPGGLLGRIVAFVIGAVVLAAAVFVGAVFLAGIVGIALIVGCIVMLRVWWLKRQMQKYAEQHGDLDAEYTVVTEEVREIGRTDSSDMNHDR
jgi:TRAP-type C4-dicarboxylate transport system permease large subunit